MLHADGHLVRTARELGRADAAEGTLRDGDLRGGRGARRRGGCATPSESVITICEFETERRVAAEEEQAGRGVEAGAAVIARGQKLHAAVERAGAVERLRACRSEARARPATESERWGSSSAGNSYFAESATSPSVIAGGVLAKVGVVVRANERRSRDCAAGPRARCRRGGTWRGSAR